MEVLHQARHGHVQGYDPALSPLERAFVDVMDPGTSPLERQRCQISVIWEVTCVAERLSAWNVRDGFDSWKPGVHQDAAEYLKFLLIEAFPSWRELVDLEMAPGPDLSTSSFPDSDTEELPVELPVRPLLPAASGTAPVPVSLSQPLTRKKSLLISRS